MFNLFTPSLDLPSHRRAFIDHTYAWLIGNFGMARLLEAPFLPPTLQHFPYANLDDPQQLEALVQQLCTEIHLQRKLIEIRIFDDEGFRNPYRTDHPLGTYQEAASGEYRLVRIARAAFAQRERLIVVLAHELMHAHLLGKGYLSDSNPDHEAMNDLALVFFGYGLLQANTLFANGEGYSLVGYLTPDELGYALALNCWLSGRDKAAAENHLPHTLLRNSFRAALRYLEKGGKTSLDKKQLQSAGSTQQFTQRIHSQRNSRDLEERRRVCEQMIRQHPENAEGWKGRGYCLLRMSEFQLALNDLERALRLEPGNPETLSRRAHCLLRLGKTAAAKTDLDRALQLDPKNSLAWRNLGLWHFERKEYNDAYGMLVKAQQLNARTELIHYYLGLVHLQRGSKLSAEWEFETSKREEETILEKYPET